MRQLLPSPQDLDDAELALRYADVPPGPWVRVNFVSTLDGSATGPDGLSGSINNAADQRVFMLLRALADVVLVGSGTAAAEGYHPASVPAELAGLRRASGRTEPPVLAVLSRSLRLPAQLLEPRPGAGTVLAISPQDVDQEAVDHVESALGPGSVLLSGSGRVDLPAAFAALRDRGLTQILCEGGPTVHAELLAAGLVDELCLTWTPLTVGGDGPRIAHGPGRTDSWRLAHLLEEEGVLIGRWIRE